MEHSVHSHTHTQTSKQIKRQIMLSSLVSVYVAYKLEHIILGLNIEINTVVTISFMLT